MDILIKIIPEKEQRKEVNGADWFFDDKGNLEVRISPMSDWRREFLLGIHEVIEGVLCKYHGVAVSDVDTFDAEYDKTHAFDVDAGDEPSAPYCKEHGIATGIERVLAVVLDVNWKEYDDELAASYPGPSKKQ